MNQILNITTEVIFGSSAIEQLKIPYVSVLLVVSGSMSEADLERVLNSVKAQAENVNVVVKPAGEPASESIDQIFSYLPDFEAIVAVGGGSALDYAKALAILGGSRGLIADYEFAPNKIVSILPMYLIPTTCGTGSEVTPYTVINNSETGRKFTIAHKDLRAKQAAIDPMLLNGLRPDVIISTSLDAFTHCLEALLTRAPTDLIWPFASRGIGLAWKILPVLKRGIEVSKVSDDLAKLSLYGGVAIAHSRTGLVHTMSVAFSKYIDEPHGILNALLLPNAIGHCLPRYGGLLAKVIGEATGRHFDSDDEAYDELVAWLDSVIDECITDKVSIACVDPDAVVQRITQDKGLPDVCHGDVTVMALHKLIEDLIHAR